MKIVALMGKSASGKDSILREVISMAPARFQKIIEYTTRPKRENEIHGDNYYFISLDNYNELVINHNLIKSSCYNNWYYGFSKNSLSSEKINVGVFTPNDVRKLKENPNIELYVYLVTANDKTRLLRSLSREDSPNVEEIVRRYLTDKEDFDNIDDISYSILYNELDTLQCANRIVEALY